VTGDAENALDFFIEAKQAEERTALARRATVAQHRLNVVAALFLPIRVVAFAIALVVRALVTRGEPARSSVVCRSPTSR
jgi:hypothetical protein